MTKSISPASTRRACFYKSWRVSHSLCRIGVGVTTSRVSRSQLTMINHVSNTREKIARDSLLRIFPPPTIERSMINNDWLGSVHLVWILVSIWTTLQGVLGQFCSKDRFRISRRGHTKRKFASPLLSRLIRGTTASYNPPTPLLSDPFRRCHLFRPRVGPSSSPAAPRLN